MKDSLAQMSKDEFRELMETVVEQKLLELLGDPDEHLKLRKAIRTRLERQRQAVAGGERDRALDEVAVELGLE
ncbi:MAG: hypothetical protein ABI614_25690 [Planctomycetota bacterium]